MQMSPKYSELPPDFPYEGPDLVVVVAVPSSRRIVIVFGVVSGSEVEAVVEAVFVFLLTSADGLTVVVPSAQVAAVHVSRRTVRPISVGSVSSVPVEVAPSSVVVGTASMPSRLDREQEMQPYPPPPSLI